MIRREFIFIAGCAMISFLFETSVPGKGFQNERKEIEKKLKKKFGLKKKEKYLVVNPENQRMYLEYNGIVLREYIVSTSKFGLGSESGSNMTPVGTHRIKEKVGKGAEPGRIFKGRIDTGRNTQIYPDKTDLEKDDVITRIMWLDGQEEGINRGGNVDSHERYIYIHGTPEEGLLGKPASHGCIRMKNSDVIELFDMVPSGTLVEILNRPFKI